MKIYVVGNCQAISVAHCLAVMARDVAVERFPVYTDLTDRATGEDVVFRQRERIPNAKVPRCAGEIAYPNVTFNAFQPDATIVRGAAVRGPLDFHSSLVLYGWHRGLSASETERLFREPVFEKLGFLSCWDTAKRMFLRSGDDCGFPLHSIFARLERGGCFMRSPNHPALSVMAEIARELARRAGVRVVVENPEDYVADPSLRGGVWPLYPEIGRSLGLPAAYAFKLPGSSDAVPLVLDLEEFIARAFEDYAHIASDVLACARLENPLYRDLESVVAGERKRSRNGAAVTARDDAREPSPYAALPASSFWRRAIQHVAGRDIDPAGPPPFRIDRGTRLATAGSCFAQHLSYALTRQGYDYFVAEAAPEGLDAREARRTGYGVFSTRSGNVYTARQLLQLFDRAYGAFDPGEQAWRRPDGRYADPFRPHVEPDGFATVKDVLVSRERHMAAVRRMFEGLDVLIFTLGLTEAWRSVGDGAVLPLAPGVSAGRMDVARYEFVNFTAAQVRDDLDAFLDRLKIVNSNARVVLTVSPQPMIATYEPRHVLAAATYSKAVLRVAVDEVDRSRSDVWYFPAYELVTGAFTRGKYFAADFRTVTPQGVDHVMRCFFAHCASDELPGSVEVDEFARLEYLANEDVVCDEEAISYDPVSTAHRPQPEGTGSNWFALELEYGPLPETAGDLAAWASTMEAMDPSSMRARIEADLPGAMRVRSVVSVACTVRNDGDVALSSAQPHPVFVCYRWYDSLGHLSEAERWIHTPLPGTLEPGATMPVSVRIAAPQHEGGYRLRVTLLQSEVAWFDDVDGSNGLEATVDVAPKTAAYV